MIYGIGIDATTITRIEKSIQNPAFIAKCFGQKEIELYEKRGLSSKTLAVCFAAKEALFKALGIGIFVYDMRCAQLLRNDKGAPYFECSGALGKLINDNNITVFVTATHEKNLAIVNVVLEKI